MTSIDTHDTNLPDNWVDHPGDSQEDGDGGSQHTCHQLGDDQYGGGRAGEDGGKGDQINAGLPIDTTHESC